MIGYKANCGGNKIIDIIITLVVSEIHRQKTGGDDFKIERTSRLHQLYLSKETAIGHLRRRRMR